MIKPYLSELTLHRFLNWVWSRPVAKLSGAVGLRSLMIATMIGVSMRKLWLWSLAESYTERKKGSCSFEMNS